MNLANRPIAWNWNLCPSLAFVGGGNDWLTLLLGVLGIALIARIVYLVIHDYILPRNRQINVNYSELLNQHIRELPLKYPIRIAHIGDSYCDLLGAENIDKNNRLDGVYDVIVVQEQVRKKYVWRHLKEDGYLIIVELPDRAGNTKIIQTIRVKDYYERPDSYLT